MELIGTASAEFERAMRDLPADAWNLPTPCDISVRELVEHVVQGNRFTALLLGGLGREEAWAVVGNEQLGPDPMAAVVASARAQASAFEDAAPDETVSGPGGESQIPVEAFLRFRLVDLVVHAWDLRRAAGIDEQLEPDLVAGLLALVEPHLEWMLEFGAYGDGPSGAVPPDATPQARLLDAFGRRP